MKKRWVILRWACTLGLTLLCGLFVISLFKFTIVSVGRSILIVVTHGTITVELDKIVIRNSPPGIRVRWKDSELGLSLWFGYDNSYAQPYLMLQVPMWFPGLALGVPTFVLWRSYLRARRVRNPCPSCGYSLTGLIAGMACPECGKATAQIGPKP